MAILKVLFLGDIVGNSGRKAATLLCRSCVLGISRILS
jgi:hypothetical protein